MLFDLRYILNGFNKVKNTLLIDPNKLYFNGERPKVEMDYKHDIVWMIMIKY